MFKRCQICGVSVRYRSWNKHITTQQHIFYYNLHHKNSDPPIEVAYEGSEFGGGDDDDDDPFSFEPSPQPSAPSAAADEWLSGTQPLLTQDLLSQHDSLHDVSAIPFPAPQNPITSHFNPSAIFPTCAVAPTSLTQRLNADTASSSSSSSSVPSYDDDEIILFKESDYTGYQEEITTVEQRRAVFGLDTVVDLSLDANVPSPVVIPTAEPDEDVVGSRPATPTTVSIADPTEPDPLMACLDKDPLEYSPPLDLLNESQRELLQLKAENSISTILMDKIIRLFNRVHLKELPDKYAHIEETLLMAEQPPETVTINEKQIHFFPLHRWLHILVMLNLLPMLLTKCSSSDYYTDMSSGNWFPKFLSRVPEGYSPLAIDIYYDHWRVSSSDKIGGLYFSIGNLPPNILMKPDNKFVLCLVPTGVNIQEVLREVLRDFICRAGSFVLTISNHTYKLYCEVARLVGDIPGLAELCALLNHRANSPCRKCRIRKPMLQNYTKLYRKKRQSKLRIIWNDALAVLAAKRKKNGKGLARKRLRRYGMQGIRCAWLSLPASHEFDLCTHSVACLMHNEELGIIKLELEGFLAIFSKDEIKEIQGYMSGMPKIPGIPKFKAGWFEHIKNLLAKEVISICKQLPYATYNICSHDKTKLRHWRCLVDHLQYFNMLGQPSLHQLLLPTLHTKIQNHHKEFKALYLNKRKVSEDAIQADIRLAAQQTNTNDSSSDIGSSDEEPANSNNNGIVAADKYNDSGSEFSDILISMDDESDASVSSVRSAKQLVEESEIMNPHVSLHYVEDIQEWGMPIYFSTMHWEPKHKQLKLNKQHQTNNHYHSRDILGREWIRQLERTKDWKPVATTPTEPTHNVQKYMLYKKSEQVDFQDHLDPATLQNLQTLIVAAFDADQLALLKYAVAFHFKIKPGINVIVEGANDEIWFAKVIRIIGYFTRLRLHSVYLQVRWYDTSKTISVSDPAQFTYVAGKALDEASYIPLSSVLGKAYISMQSLPINSKEYPLVIDTCYFVRKWHDLLDVHDE